MKSDFIGHNLKCMTFYEQIYVDVLPKQQVLPQKNMVKFFFWSLWVAEAKRKTFNRALLKNARFDVFGFFITYHFFITFERIHKTEFFQQSRFFA